jgi:hypothetical protein
MNLDHGILSLLVYLFTSPYLNFDSKIINFIYSCDNSMVKN